MEEQKADTVEIEIPAENTSTQVQPPIAQFICTTANCKTSPKKYDNIAEFEEHVRKTHTGRPCEYCQNKEKIDKITNDYLNDARVKKGTKAGFVPYIQELADLLDCWCETVTDWAEKKNEAGNIEHPDFHRAIKKLNNFKELMLLKRTMGRFNPTGAIFQLKTKHGYIETEKQIHAGDVNEPLEIRIIEERAKPDGQ